MQSCQKNVPLAPEISRRISQLCTRVRYVFMSFLCIFQWCNLKIVWLCMARICDGDMIFFLFFVDIKLPWNAYHSTKSLTALKINEYRHVSNRSAPYHETWDECQKLINQFSTKGSRSQCANYIYTQQEFT